jgi:pectate lyase
LLYYNVYMSRKRLSVLGTISILSTLVLVSLFLVAEFVPKKVFQITSYAVGAALPVSDLSSDDIDTPSEEEVELDYPEPQAVSATSDESGNSSYVAQDGDVEELEKRIELLNEVKGYGEKTKGGSSGEIYRVTTLSGEGPGSLREAVESSKALWIVFDVDGSIDLKRKPLKIKSFKTIDGRGANVTILGAPVQIFDAQNVIVENITIGKNSQVIGLRVLRSKDVWLDHISFTGGISKDGDRLYANLLAIMDGSTRVTVSWSSFRNQDKGVEIGHSNKVAYKNDESMYVTLYNNYLTAARRNPRVNRAHVHAFNNVVSNWACNGYGMSSSNSGKLYADSNMFSGPKSCKNTCTAQAAAIRSGDVVNATSCTVAKLGAVHSARNLFLSSPELVGKHTPAANIFKPTDHYKYTAKKPSSALMKSIIADVGATRRSY